MDLNIYQVIVGPVISSDAYKQNKQLNKLVLRVHPKANKSQIAEALEKLFNVKVEKVNTSTRQGKRRIVQKRMTTTGTLSKKAIVTLKKGYTLDLLDQAGNQTVTKQEAA